MKRVALLVQDLCSEYFTEMVEGARRLCAERGWRLFVFIVRGRNWGHGSFDYQYCAAEKLVTRGNADGIVLATNTYCQNVPMILRAKLVREFSFLPLVSLGAAVQGVAGVVSSCRGAYGELLAHLVDGHGRRRPVLLCPVSTSADIAARRQAFTEFMAERGIPLDEKSIIYADYIEDSVRKVLGQICPRREDVYFDAVVSCTDGMALGCISYLREIGVSVPADVSVTGFDNELRCISSNPTLSTVDPDIGGQAYIAAGLLGKECVGAECVSVPAKFVPRASCGCAAEESGDDRRRRLVGEERGLLHREMLNTLRFFLQELQATLPLPEFRRMLVGHLRSFDIGSCVLVLYPSPVPYGKDGAFEPPATAWPLVAFDAGGTRYDLEGATISPASSMIPDGFEFEEGKEVVVQSLFNASLQYGYVAYTPGRADPHVYELAFSAVGTAFASHCIVTQKDEEARRFAEASVTDAMTGALNRSGFMRLADEAVAEALLSGLCGAVVYGDMDGLKAINDTLGHDMGDAAIRAEVGVLRRVFRSSDVLGRLGGDEFAIVAPGLSEGAFKNLCARIDAATEEYNRTSGKPFRLSISLGASFFTPVHRDLNILLKEADSRQYEQKRLHHLARG